jgi:hypothetical protein
VQYLAKDARKKGAEMLKFSKYQSDVLYKVHKGTEKSAGC